MIYCECHIHTTRIKHKSRCCAYIQFSSSLRVRKLLLFLALCAPDCFVSVLFLFLFCVSSSLSVSHIFFVDNKMLFLEVGTQVLVVCLL